MDTREFEALKKKAETLKDKRSRLQGNLDTLNAQLASMKLSSLEEAIEKQRTLTEDIAQNQALQEGLFQELKGCTAWQFV